MIIKEKKGSFNRMNANLFSLKCGGGYISPQKAPNNLERNVDIPVGGQKLSFHYSVGRREYASISLKRRDKRSNLMFI